MLKIKELQQKEDEDKDEKNKFITNEAWINPEQIEYIETASLDYPEKYVLSLVSGKDFLIDKQEVDKIINHLTKAN